MSRRFEIVNPGQANANFRNLHPTPAAKKILRGDDLPPHLESDGSESKLLRCKQCGWIIDTTITTHGSGYGNLSSLAVTTDAGGTANSKDEVIGGGCPLCGASEYE